MILTKWTELLIHLYCNKKCLVCVKQIPPLSDEKICVYMCSNILWSSQVYPRYGNSSVKLEKSAIIAPNCYE